MNKGLKNKGLGSWFCLAAALVALITGIVFLLTQATAAPLGHSGTMAGVVLLVGAAAPRFLFWIRRSPPSMGGRKAETALTRSESRLFFMPSALERTLQADGRQIVLQSASTLGKPVPAR